MLSSADPAARARRPSGAGTLALTVVPTAAALLGAALGCGTPPTPGPTPVEEPATELRREVIRGGAGQPGVTEYHPPPNRARVLDFRASPDSLWPRVVAAYQALGLPLGEVDTGARSVGTSSQRVLGRLGGARLSEYLDCGSDALGVRAADTYIVTLRATTSLHAVPDAAPPVTTVRTRGRRTRLNPPRPTSTRLSRNHLRPTGLADCIPTV